jgi:hypothetical protein
VRAATIVGVFASFLAYAWTFRVGFSVEFVLPRHWYDASIQSGMLRLGEGYFGPNGANKPTGFTSFGIEPSPSYRDWNFTWWSDPSLGWILGIPLWPVPALLGASLIVGWRRRVRARKRALSQPCPSCAYPLAELPSAIVCPECGKPVRNRGRAV